MSSSCSKHRDTLRKSECSWDFLALFLYSQEEKSCFSVHMKRRGHPPVVSSPLPQEGSSRSVRLCSDGISGGKRCLGSAQPSRQPPSKPEQELDMAGAELQKRSILQGRRIMISLRIKASSCFCRPEFPVVTWKRISVPQQAFRNFQGLGLISDLR